MNIRTPHDVNEAYALHLLTHRRTIQSWRAFRQSIKFIQMMPAKNLTKCLIKFWQRASKLVAQSPVIRTRLTPLMAQELVMILRRIDIKDARRRYHDIRSNSKRNNPYAQPKKPQEQAVERCVKSLGPLQCDLDTDDIINSRCSAPSIGLGTEPTTHIPRVKSSEVVIDKNTTTRKKTDKSILYAAGWSIEGAFTKD